MPQFDPEHPFGLSFTPDNDTQAGLVSQFADYATEENPLQGEELLESIREIMSPMQLVHADIVKKLQIYTKIKNYLNRCGIEVPVTETSGTLLARRLIHRIWDDDIYEMDRNAALEAFDNIRNGVASSPSNSPTASGIREIRVSTRDTSDARDASESYRPTLRSLASSMAKRFSLDSSKFSGHSEDCWDTYLDNYIRACREMELSTELKVKFVHHILRGHALVFYKDFIEDKTQNWGEILRIMGDEFNSDVRMEAVADRLRALHVSKFEMEGGDEMSALRALAKQIQLLTPQAPRECRTDRHRRMTLQDATRGRQWAYQVTSSSHAKRLSYQQLLHELENSLQQYQVHLSYQDDLESSENSIFRKSRISGVNFAGQGRYGRDPKSRLSNKPSSTLKTKTAICWNCEEPGCYVSKCKAPRNPDRIRKNRIKFFEARQGGKLDRKVRSALLQFSYLIDDDSPSEGESSDSEGLEEADDDKLANIHHSLTKTQIEQRAQNSTTTEDTEDF